MFNQALLRLIPGLDMQEFNLAQNLVISPQEDKRAYLPTFVASTFAAISFQPRRPGTAHPSPKSPPTNKGLSAFAQPVPKVPIGQR